VLIAEDDALIQDIIRHFLCEEGYRVESAYTYSEAVQALTDARFDLVLADTMGVTSTQPAAGRWAMLEQIRDLAGETPVVIVTGHRYEAFADFRARGFRDLLLKPFTLRRLLTLVDRHITAPGS
jgi:CheY-like chemotaxis protein